MDINERLLRTQEAKRRRVAALRKRVILFCTICLLIIVSSVTFFITNKKNEHKSLLQQYYETFVDEHNLNTAQTDTDFADWFYKNYSQETIAKVIDALKKDKLNNEVIYSLTGESMFVLSDRYQNLISKEHQIYERTGKASGEAEITIAGDLCFAEDGFVLDYYDTVNDLEQCISPELLDIMNQSDIFYLNHEFCISDKGTALEGKFYTFRANPERLALLEEMGTDLVSLANNHVYDYGEEALLDTCDNLETSDIAYVGGGRDNSEAERPVYFIVNGIKIGFVAASNAEKYFFTPQATEDHAGILTAYDTTVYNQVIQDASSKCDYLIAYIHWGTEDSNYINKQQQAQGREFLDSGADIVIGGHPHLLQGIEYVDGKPIVYSLGDFWFNSETKYTGLLQLNIDINGLNKMSFVPCQQTNFTTQYLENSKDQENLFTFLEDLSENIEINSDGIITQK